MNLKVMTPTELLIEAEVSKVVAEADNGSFCLLPHHIDFVSTLVPGLLSFATPDGEETFLAVDEGVLVKCGPTVRVSCSSAVVTGELGAARQTVKSRIHVRSEREKRARTALARLELDLLRRISELGRNRE